MRRGLLGLLVLVGGCLDMNPVFVEPTMTGPSGPSGPDTSEGPPTTGVTTTSSPGSEATTVDPSATTSVDETTGAPGTVTTDTPDTENGVAECGNGKVEPGEQCDDGNDAPNDECRDDCTAPVCGDEMVQGGEECDDGNQMDDDECLPDCVMATCGDGKLLVGQEECDDGNKVDDDFCRDSCKEAFCGDGVIIQGFEDCEDGNNKDGDGCEANCLFTPKVIFVTSQAYPGALGGILSADGICAALAGQGMVPPGVYLAWLSDSKTSPDQRMTKSPGPYLRADGMPIAMSWADLTDGSIMVPIDKTEKMGKPPMTDSGTCGFDGLFSNTNPDGTLYSVDDSCGDWNLTGGNTFWGSTTKTGPGWTKDCEADLCGMPTPFLCVQQ